MAKIDDLEKIINGCKNGDNDSFAKLLELYANRIYGYFYRLTANRDICDEMLSQLFAKIVTKIKSYKGPNFDSWIFRIASNIFYDYLRDKQRREKLKQKHKQNLEENAHSLKQSDIEIFDKLQIELEKIDEDTRELIMLRFYSQLSFKEIAQLRSLPIGTVLSRVHRGLKKLRELME